MAPRTFHPDELAAAYDFLRTTPPFRRWKLPPSDEITFVVNKHAQNRGDFHVDANDRPVMRVSMAAVSHTNSLLAVIAHESIHLYQWRTKRETANTKHNADFHRLAARVCAIHGFDAVAFI